MKVTDLEQGISVRLQRTNAQFRKVHIKGGDDIGKGTFLFLLDVTALSRDVYIPISVASGKKPTGFIYQIEGTKAGTIATTEITCEGKDISQITLGTIIYCKVPATKIGTFRIIVEMQGKLGGDYTVVLNRIHYKYDPSDARYLKLEENFRSESVSFS